MLFSRATLLTLSTVALRGVLSISVDEITRNSFGYEGQEVLAQTTPIAPHFAGYEGQEVLTGGSPTSPRFVVYGDAGDGNIGPPPPAKIKGWNVYALSFLLLEGAWDKAYEWTSLTDSQRTKIKSQYADAGIKLIVSAFGSTDVPTTIGANPNKTADTMAAWVKKYKLDGIDVDYEDFGAFETGNGKAEKWLIDFTKQLRTHLPQGSYILTHAPVAPWFTPNRWPGGGYLKVHQSVGNLIDWYNIQFYNQGANEYTTCDNLLNKSSKTWPQSALFQIAQSGGVPQNKLVIGKPASTGDAASGYMSTSLLAGCVQQAKSKGWSGGVMAWEYPRADSSWITNVRSKSWPVYQS